MSVKFFIKGWLSAVSPVTVCALCKQPSLGPVCEWCKNDTQFFYADAQPLNLLLRPAIARHLRHTGYSLLLACGYYAWPFDEMVSRFKFNGDMRLATILGQWLAQSCSQLPTAMQPELLLPVPLRTTGYWQRQFNQAEVLASVLGRELSIPVYRQWARRRRGLSQHRLNRSARFTNLRQAFSISELPNVTRVAIVDDVVTTGCTADALANLLRRAPPHLQIQVWALAVTPAPGKKAKV